MLNEDIHKGYLRMHWFAKEGFVRLLSGIFYSGDISNANRD